MSTEFGQECRATGRTVSTLVLQLAEEVSSDGQVPLSELERILEAIDGMGMIFEMSKTRCIKNSRCNGIAYRRNQLLGRILAQPLESQLFACPPILRRNLLSPMFSAISKMVGESLFGELEQKARNVYFAMLSSRDHFEWSPFYESKDSISSYCQLMVLLSCAFRVYAEAKKEFIGLMKAADPIFALDDYFLLMCGLTRPLKLAATVSWHRSFMEQALLVSERRQIDNFLLVLEGDRAQWKALPRMRRGQA